MGLSETEMLLAVLVSSAMQIWCFIFPFIGSNGRKIYMAGAILMAGGHCGVPLNGYWFHSLIVLGLGSLDHYFDDVWAPAAMLAELFRSQIFWSLFGLSVGSYVGGGAAPIVATAILASTGEL